jgi:3-deoxy-D-manno-octulosonic-acid transferase
LWPNLVRAARETGAHVAVINGRLSESSYRGYRRIRPLVAGLLEQIDLIAVQDQTYAARFRGLGAASRSVHVTGSMKYDGAETDRSNPSTERLRRLAGFTEDDIVLLAGSTQDPEERYALETYRGLSPRWPRLRLVLVPRHPDRFAAVARLLDESGLPWQRRTDLDSDGPAPQARILLVDALGELGAWWGAARIGFVGGSMGSRGGQNMIEPAAYGVAVSFGPNTRNFRDIVSALLAHDAAVVVQDSDQLTTFVRRCLDDAEYADALGQRARSLVASQLGATQRTFRMLETLMEPPGAPVPRPPHFEPFQKPQRVAQTDPR